MAVTITKHSTETLSAQKTPRSSRKFHPTSENPRVRTAQEGGIKKGVKKGRNNGRVSRVHVSAPALSDKTLISVLRCALILFFPSPLPRNPLSTFIPRPAARRSINPVSRVLFHSFNPSCPSSRPAAPTSLAGAPRPPIRRVGILKNARGTRGNCGKGDRGVDNAADQGNADSHSRNARYSGGIARNCYTLSASFRGRLLQQHGYFLVSFYIPLPLSFR